MEYHVLGIMSGTSLDGVDMAMCRFTQTAGKWSFTINETLTAPIEEAMRNRLMKAIRYSAVDLLRLDQEIGAFMGNAAKVFIEDNHLSPLFIASHGHTVFHAPDKGFTWQIGSGAKIHAVTGLPVVCDFRTVDVALGGQGAPLVPVGDEALFSDYNMCLNLGGIANISIHRNGNTEAFDVCPANILLNFLAHEKHQAYDEGGKGARAGEVNSKLLEKLNSLDFYQREGPKSLGREWVEDKIFPLLAGPINNTDNLLATASEHIADQVCKTVSEKGDNGDRLLVTGGGAFNDYLLERIRAKLPEGITLVVPEKKIIEYKEALIFAFLGLLRVLNQNNCFKSVTGASRDNIGGAIYGKMLNNN